MPTGPLSHAQAKAHTREPSQPRSTDVKKAGQADQTVSHTQAGEPPARPSSTSTNLPQPLQSSPRAYQLLKPQPADRAALAKTDDGNEKIDRILTCSSSSPSPSTSTAVSTSALESPCRRCILKADLFFFSHALVLSTTSPSRTPPSLVRALSVSAFPPIHRAAVAAPCPKLPRRLSKLPAPPFAAASHGSAAAAREPSHV
jgi:hypothetical protein